MGDGSAHAQQLVTQEALFGDSGDSPPPAHRARLGGFRHEGGNMPGLSGADLRKAIVSALGEEPAPDVLSHLDAEAKKLSAKVFRSLNLMD